eukprot:Seg1389.10 transcript_id=Seg1389.10/GoldUCD/mRNA.D3Y31 product="hypothetical protein" protein_id=Seg1389.10/GoldUCD/D3Y31
MGNFFKKLAAVFVGLFVAFCICRCQASKNKVNGVTLTVTKADIVEIGHQTTFAIAFR